MKISLRSEFRSLRVITTSYFFRFLIGGDVQGEGDSALLDIEDLGTMLDDIPVSIQDLDLKLYLNRDEISLYRRSSVSSCRQEGKSYNLKASDIS